LLTLPLILSMEAFKDIFMPLEERNKIESGVYRRLLELFPAYTKESIWAVIRDPQCQTYPFSEAHLELRCLQKTLDPLFATVGARTCGPGDVTERVSERITARRLGLAEPGSSNIAVGKRKRATEAAEGAPKQVEQSFELRNKGRCKFPGCGTRTHNMRHHVLEKHLPPCFKPNSDIECEERHINMLASLHFVCDHLGLNSLQELSDYIIEKKLCQQSEEQINTDDERLLRSFSCDAYGEAPPVSLCAMPPNCLAIVIIIIIISSSSLSSFFFYFSFYGNISKFVVQQATC
jgi:hypothetical protein